MDNKASDGTGTLTGVLDKPLQWDLVGPTVEADIRRVLRRYGAAAVQDAVKKLTKPIRGRPKINDWKELRHVVETDAREWLDGGDPIAARTNYAIAKEFADSNAGASSVSTHQRIERKLGKKPHDRQWYMLVTAMELSRDNYPHMFHIRALEALEAIEPHSFWASALLVVRSDIAEFEAKNSEPPAAELTMKQVEDGARNALLTLSQPRNPRGLFGLPTFPGVKSVRRD